jgi:exopolysaccharide biosynthesis polyprenyl glycosylphosphotransferase
MNGGQSLAGTVAAASTALSDLDGQLDERTAAVLERRRRATRVRRRGWLVRRVLLAADALGLVLALTAVEVVRNGAGDSLTTKDEVLFVCLMFPFWVVLAKLAGLYERDEERAEYFTIDELVALVNVATVATWAFYVVVNLDGLAALELSTVTVFWVAWIAGLATARAFARALVHRHVLYLQNAVVVGAGHVGQAIATKFVRHPERGINVVALMDDVPRELAAHLRHLAVLDVEQLPFVVRLLDVERVIIAFTGDSHHRTLSLLRDLERLQIRVDVVPRFFEGLGPSVRLYELEGMPLLSLPRVRISRSMRFVKRVFDVVVSFSLLVLGLPLFAYIAWRVRSDDRGPILYRQARVGRGGAQFDAFKFRTMHVRYCRGDAYGGEAAERAIDTILAERTRGEEFRRTHKLRDDPRVTPYGRRLRQSSLDELPQLLNVLRGDISLVGPRAITNDEYEQYCTQEGNIANAPSWLEGYWKIKGLRPGLTGYWQINGRSEVSYRERVRLDLAYVRNWSFPLDLKILAKTLRVLVSRQGAY